jgi:hypothetical protein
MEQVDFKRAYYIKLGRGGEWQQSSISESKLRLGWLGQSLEDINSGNWEKIRKQLSTRDLNALRWICESSSEDLWITFIQGTMWWCKLGSNKVFKDNESQYRQVDGKWSNQDINSTVLDISSVPGVLSKYQRYQGTVCRIRELETLKRLVNAERSLAYAEIDRCEADLYKSVEKGIKGLHWKDFETLVDLVFRESGWRRVSVKGETMEYIDLELEDPITEERYLVQIKSEATYKEFISYANQFDPHPPIRWLYFVVHSPDDKLAALQEPRPDVKLIRPGQLSEMVVRLGLVDWLKVHIK